MRREYGLIKKRNLEYLQVKDQFQEKYFVVWLSVSFQSTEEEFINGNLHFRVSPGCYSRTYILYIVNLRIFENINLF